MLGNEEKVKIKVAADQNILGVTKLIKMGGSFGVTIPRVWVDFHCIDVDDEYYLIMEVEGNRLIFSPINLEDIKDIRIRVKEEK